MHFAWIAQRLASSRSPTKYASAASCIYIYMVHAWKCMLYFPTSRAILQTRCEKGSLHIRRFILFWKCWIFCRATVPSQYLWGFFTLPTFRNSFWEALPPTVGQSFLLTGSSPSIDGPASAAIWAKCWVGDKPHDLHTSPTFSASSTFLSSSLWVGTSDTASGAGGSASAGGFLILCMDLVLGLHIQPLLSSLF